MSLIINHNITSLNAWRNLTTTDRKMSAAMEKLSSGMRINRAADDPAGLVISEKMRAQLSGLSSAAKNVEKGINLIATAEASLDKVNSLLVKMRSLSVDSLNSAVNDTEMVAANQKELDEAVDSIDRIATKTKFGSLALLDGTFTSKTFQVGANSGDTVTVSIGNMSKAGLSINSLTQITAATTLTAIDAAIKTVSTERGKLGATQADNLEVQLDALRVAFENLQAAESTIRDTDMTKEMAEFTKMQIMMQAGTAMLAQANQLPNNVLQLLR